MPQKSPAQGLLEKANKKANSSTGWFSSASTKFEEAGDLYQQAANSFKLEKLFDQAGDSFAREAECREKCNEPNEAANAWWNAAKAYKQDGEHPELAIGSFNQAIPHLTKLGRFRQAADRKVDLAKMFIDLRDFGGAIDSYVDAHDWYAQEDAPAFASKCLSEAADLISEHTTYYDRAIDYYERVADYMRNSNLTKYNVKEYLLRALLCALASGDQVKVGLKLTDYKNKDGFGTTREYLFAESLWEAVGARDIEAFVQAVGDFDKMTRLEGWKAQILLKTKVNIPGGA